MKLSREEQLSKRFYILNAVVSVMLLVVIVVSVFQFGAHTFESRRTIGMVLPDKITDTGWNKSQYDGMRKAAEDLNYNLVTMEDVKTDKQSLNEAVDALVKRRAKTIFFANCENLNAAFEVASHHPNISFYGIEAEKSDIPMKKYFVRYAEAYYLAGIIAGLRTVTEKVGFISPGSSPGLNQMVNAFTLGVRKIKPNAQVYISYTGAFKAPTLEEQAVRDMKAHNADVIAYFADGATIAEAAARARIDFISLFNSTKSAHNLATIMVNWQGIYKTLFRREVQGGGSVYIASVMDRGVEVILNKHLDARGRAIFEAEVFEIKEGKNIFTGPIWDNRGILRVKENEIISNKSLDKMSYLAQGVITLGN